MEKEYTTKNPSRAIRRHHRERRKAKFCRLFKRDCRWSPVNEQPSYIRILQLAASYAKTRTKCSCWMCGNPRKYEKEITLKEKIALDKYKYDMYNGGVR